MSETKQLKQAITHVFKSVSESRLVIDYLKIRGFKKAKHGCRKSVYIHRKFPFVVKIALAGFDEQPNKRSNVAKFYLWPEKAAVRTFPSGRNYTLYFQPKADVRDRFKTFALLEEALFKANAYWRDENKKAGWKGDPHAGNVALYRRKPVIIDY